MPAAARVLRSTTAAGVPHPESRGSRDFSALLPPDEAFAQLQASSDPDEQQDLLLQIEQNLWSDAFGVTIFQHPGITAYNGTYVSGIDSIALTPTVFWNFWEWEAA